MSPLPVLRVAPLWKQFAARFSRRDLLEAAIVAVAFLLYFGVRGAVIDRPEAAYRHALDIIDAQRALGFFWEDDLNNWVKDKLFVTQAMNLVYFYLHFPLIIVFGIWLYYFRREKYTLTRDAFLASGRSRSWSTGCTRWRRRGSCRNWRRSSTRTHRRT